MPPFHDRERVTNFWNNSRKISNLKRKRKVLKKGKLEMTKQEDRESKVAVKKRESDS